MKHYIFDLAHVCARLSDLFVNSLQLYGAMWFNMVDTAGTQTILFLYIWFSHTGGIGPDFATLWSYVVQDG